MVKGDGAGNYLVVKIADLPRGKANGQMKPYLHDDF